MLQHAKTEPDIKQAVPPPRTYMSQGEYFDKWRLKDKSTRAFVSHVLIAPVQARCDMLLDVAHAVMGQVAHQNLLPQLQDLIHHVPQPVEEITLIFLHRGCKSNEHDQRFKRIQNNAEQTLKHGVLWTEQNEMLNLLCWMSHKEMDPSVKEPTLMWNRKLLSTTSVDYHFGGNHCGGIFSGEDSS